MCDEQNWILQDFCLALILIYHGMLEQDILLSWYSAPSLYIPYNPEILTDTYLGDWNSVLHRIYIHP